MNKKNNCKKYFLTLVLIVGVQFQAETFHNLMLPDALKQGNAYFIECTGFQQGSVLQFEFSDKSKSPKFPLVRFPVQTRRGLMRLNVKYVTAFLTGIHPLAHPGPGLIKVFNKNDKLLYTIKVVIEAVQWKKEVIALNNMLSNLVTKPDPEKEIQAKRYQEILNTVSQSHVWLIDRLQVPVVKARVTSEFGTQRHYVYANGSKNISFHAGVDFGKEQDTYIYASGSGRVVFAENRIITGNTAIIEHLPGVYSIYMHMENLKVKTLDNVTAGMVIGVMGSTGLATGTHLHWETRICNVPVDPMSLVHIDFFSKLHTINTTQEGGDFN